MSSTVCDALPTAGSIPAPSAFALAPAAMRARLGDARRLAALQATGLLAAGGDEVLDRLARTASRLLGVPVALVSLVDDEGQRFVGMAGLGGWAGAERGTPLSHSFCQYVVAGEDPLVVADAGAHPVLRDNGAYGALGVVAYAGVPLRTSDGETLGSFCAIDTAPRAWTDEQIAGLRDLAAAAMAEIELRAALRVVEAQRMRIAESERRLRQATLAAQMAAWSYDLVTDTVTVSPEWGPLFGLARGASYPTMDAFLASLHADDRARVAAAIDDAHAGRRPYEAEFRVRHPDGCTRWVHDLGEVTRDADGRAIGMTGMIRDVTDRKRADEAREAAEARFRAVLEHVESPVVCLDADGNVTFANDALLRATGWRRDEVLGTDWFGRFVPARFAVGGPAALQGRYRAALRAGALDVHTERQVLARDGSERTVRWDNVVLRDADGRPVGAASIGQDVTELRRAQSLLREQAIRDELTGLLNRRGFAELARQQLAVAERAGTPCVLVNLDLTDFKSVNDRFGHDVGDQALVEVAGLLSATFRTADVVARLGGDEFVVLATGSGAAEVPAIRRRVLEAFATASAAPGREFPLGTSVGIVVFDPAAPTSFAQLLRAADHAMYADKRAARQARRAAVGTVAA